VAYHVLPQYRTGVIALVALVLLVASSALRERLPLRYEVWRASPCASGGDRGGRGLHHALTAGRFSALGAVQGWWWGVAVALLAGDGHALRLALAGAAPASLAAGVGHQTGRPDVGAGHPARRDRHA
jgi:hypothetical protein